MRSRKYQYLLALRDFGLNRAEVGKGEIIPSQELIDIGTTLQNRFLQDGLTDEERREFTPLFLRHPYVASTFLPCFVFSLEGKVINCNELETNGKPVFLTSHKHTGGRSAEQRGLRRITVRLWDDRLVEQDETTFVYTVGKWATELQLFDNITFPEGYDIRDDELHVLYPIRFGIDDALRKQFMGAIVGEFQGTSIPMPKIIHWIVTRFRFQIQAIHGLLKTISAAEPEVFYLQRTSGSFLRPRDLERNMFLIADGTYRSHLLVTPRR